MNDATYFLLRRLHSLTGIVAVGGFLIEHVYTNAYILESAQAYNAQVAVIQKLPFLHVIEILFIGMPLAFHSLYGVAITFASQPNNLRYHYGANWRYLLQRVTGILALVFIVMHVWTMRFVNFPADGDFYGEVVTVMSQPLSFALYLVGTASVVYHFVNGLWAGAIVWGVTVSTTSQRFFRLACYGLGMVLFGVTLASMLTTSTLFSF